MSDYDQFLPKDATKPAASKGGNEYDRYLLQTAGPPTAKPPVDFRGAQRAALNVAKKAGSALVSGHHDPWGNFMGALGAPDRALHAAETLPAPVAQYNNPLDYFTKPLGQISHAFMTPNEGPALDRKVKERVGLAALERGPLAGNDLGHKLLRGTADTALDIGNSALTFMPMGDLGKLAMKIPGVAGATSAVGHAIADSPLGHVLNPSEYLRGLTPEARAQYEVITNRAMEAVRQRKIAEDKIVQQHAAEIRKGIMPPEVARLFSTHASDKGVQQGEAWKKFFTDKTGKFTFGPGTRPQDVQRALYENRAPMFQGSEHQMTGALGDLRREGFLHQPAAYEAGIPTKFDTADQQAIEEIQKRLRSNIEHKMRPEATNPMLQAARTFTHRGNQAFLANPVPHTFNLANLAYNEYGLPTVARGIGNAVRVALGKTGGKLGADIGELEGLGAKSQYGNIFDELGLTRIAGIPGTEGAARLANKALIPAQRASNYAQHKILNSAETGLRAAALGAEKRAGRAGAAAAQNIHRTFGTDAPNRLTEGASQIGAPFAKFHLQTVPATAARTLAKNPARVANVIKAQRDENAQINAGGAPKYRTTVPGAQAARVFADPFGYSASMTGPLGALTEMLHAASSKGNVGKVAADTAARFTPGSAELGALAALLSGKKGPSGESALGDLGSAIFGGYYQKGGR